MLLIFIAAFCTVASAADPKACFKYDETYGKFEKSLKETATDCANANGGMKQPEQAKCVMGAYGAIDANWALHCETFKKFIDDYITDKAKSGTMKTNAVDNCSCKDDAEENEREKIGREFITCWKAGLDSTCPDDSKLVKDE